MAETPLWEPSAERIEAANLTHFARRAIGHWKLGINNYPDFYRWSVSQPEQFWESLWDFAGVRASAKGGRVLWNGDKMPGARWFPEGRLNFAQNLLRRRDASTAIAFWGEDRVKRRVTHRELYDQVSRLAQALRTSGVRPGDRVVAFLPNMPEAVTAMLAAASIGASVSTCSPDFGVQGVLDRFGQIDPVILFAADGYYYNGKTINSMAKVAEIAGQIPSLQKVVIVPYVHRQHDLAGLANGVMLDELLAPHRQVDAIEAKAHVTVLIVFQSGSAPDANPVQASEPITSPPSRMRTRTAPWLRSYRSGCAARNASCSPSPRSAMPLT